LLEKDLKNQLFEERTTKRLNDKATKQQVWWQTKEKVYQKLISKHKP